MKEVGKTGAGPELTAASETALKLFAQRLHRPTAHRGSDPLHFLGVERVARVLEVDDLTSEGCFGLRGPRDGPGWGERQRIPEGLNSVFRTVKRRSRGFRSQKYIKVRTLTA